MCNKCSNIAHLVCIFIIRIFNGCEMQIENSIKRVFVWHQEACRVMLNSYPEWRKFQFAPNNQSRFFFLHTFPSTIAFKLQYALFSQFYAKISVFSIKECSISASIYDVDVKTVGGKWRQNWCCDVKKTTWCHVRESSYTPSCKTTFPNPSWVHGNLVEYAREIFLDRFFLHTRLGFPWTRQGLGNVDLYEGV